MKSEFSNAILKNQSSFDLSLSEQQILKLSDYYDLIMRENKLLHLVGPCSIEEFVIRHILESLYALHFLPKEGNFVDIGSGAGLPGIPCLIVREKLNGLLIDSKLKKAKFLKKTTVKLGLESRAKVFDKQFSESKTTSNTYVMCRALDKFTRKLPQILKWSKKSKMLLFSGNQMREELEKSKVKFKETLIPMSERRFLFQVNP